MNDRRRKRLLRNRDCAKVEVRRYLKGIVVGEIEGKVWCINAEGEEERVIVMWLVKVFVRLCLRCGNGDEARHFAFVR